MSEKRTLSEFLINQKQIFKTSILINENIYYQESRVVGLIPREGEMFEFYCYF